MSVTKAEALDLYHKQEQQINYRHHRELLNLIVDLLGSISFRDETRTQDQFVYPYTFTVDYVVVDEVWFSLEGKTFKAETYCPHCRQEFCCYPYLIEHLGKMWSELEDCGCIRGWFYHLFHTSRKPPYVK